MEPKGPERLSEILGRLFAARGWGRQQDRLHLERAWAEAVGPAYATITRVGGLKRRTLEVEVKGAVPLQELSQFHKRGVLERLRKAMAGTTIADIRFRAGMW